MNNLHGQRVWIGQISSEDSINKNVEEMAVWLNLGKQIPRNARIVIKPNMTYPHYKRGVSTGYEIINAVVRVLLEISPNITIVESDGGSYAWPAEQSFEGHGIPDICSKYKIQAVNLTKLPKRKVDAEVDGMNVSVELPTFLLENTDYFITMPVPKVHVMTTVSLGFKNQWGCLPDVKRLRNHPDFARKIIAINKILNPRLAIFDGTYFLNKSGPMIGDQIKMDLVVGGDIGATTLLCCCLMGIDPKSVGHLKIAIKEGLMPESIDQLELNRNEIESLKKEKFYLKRKFMDWLALAAFHNSLLTRILYDSPLAKPIHDFLYLIRGKPKDFIPKW